MNMLPQKRSFDSLDRADNEALRFEQLSSNNQQWYGSDSFQLGGFPVTSDTWQQAQWDQYPNLAGLQNVPDYYDSFPQGEPAQILPSILINGQAQLPSKTKVCFGMLHEVRAKLLISMASLEEMLSGSTKDDAGNYVFQITKQRNDFVISMQMQDRIAVINEMISRALRAIWDLETIHFQAYVSPNTWSSVEPQRKSSKKEVYLTININLYGDRYIKETIGDTLSSSQLYLQHPGFKEPGCEYDNPHFVTIPNVLPKLANSLASKTTNQSPSKLSPELENPENEIQNEIAVVFSSLTRARYLSRLDADVRIKTPLLHHQKEALQFMAQREFGPVPKAFSLWREVQTDSSNGACFEHILTGSKRQYIQSETGGGILADDMGLGKTLTCLATVTRTAQLATQFWETGYTVQGNQVNEVQTRRHAARATLVILPSHTLINSWQEEILKHVYGGLRICIYHGRGRETNPEVLAKADIVFSTYHTVSTEGNKSGSVLSQITWFRIVLDEAHFIRSKSSNLYQTASRLDAKLRWCLTGTPVQNKLEDIGSLVSFLRIPLLDTPPAFKKHVIDPLMKGTGVGSENLRVLLDSICLRRSKNLLDLPDIEVKDRVLEFSEAEIKQYKTAELEMSKAIKQQANLENSKKRYLGIFQMEMQLRRLCNHGTFQKPFSVGPDDNQQGDTGCNSTTTQPNKDAQCDFCERHMSRAILGGDLFDGHFTVCGHLLCSKCLPEFEQKLVTAKDEFGLRCPLCQTRLNEDYLQTESIAPAVYFEESGVSTKVLGLLADIENNSRKGKSIIFSGWTKSLDLIARLFTSRQILFERIDGSCSVNERNRTLDAFRRTSRTQILMMTTGTGAVGLNLAVANFVYILEPQWNPMVESQAIARVSRLGQKKKVSVFRYIMKGTVEETLRSQQIRKLALADVGWRDDIPGA